MKKRLMRNRAVAAMLLWSLFVLPMAVVAQTTVRMPKNKYKVQQDIELGEKTSRQVEQQFPILNDGMVDNYVEDVGRRLVDAIPAEFRQPAFRYEFDVVNARDINAFALPGGPMYVNRGMIEAAKNEGEMAGVMAHEIAHVALRHATAQATKQSSWKNQLGMIGLILGGAVAGGETGAQLGMLGAQAWMTKYSREYETQADVIGARIMAGGCGVRSAGSGEYVPDDLAGGRRTRARMAKQSPRPGQPFPEHQPGSSVPECFLEPHQSDARVLTRAGAAAFDAASDDDGGDPAACTAHGRCRQPDLGRAL
jgi:hypothetical protein